MNEIEKIKEQIISTELDSTKRHDLIFELIDNHKGDKTIVPFFIKLIKNENIEDLDGTLIYAINEYSLVDSVPYLELLIELVCHSNFESSWSAGNLINDLRNHDLLLGADGSTLNKCYDKLVHNFTSNNPNIEIIKDIIFYLEEDNLVRVNKRVVPN